MNTPATLTTPLLQSRNGGKVHHASCGQRSRYAAPLRNTEGMTYAEVLAAYGDELCRYCFPQSIAGRAATLTTMRAENTAAAEATGPVTCPGSYTHDWKGGEPTKTGYYTGNGGTCAHCNKWVPLHKNSADQMIRKHTII